MNKLKLTCILIFFTSLTRVFPDIEISAVYPYMFIKNTETLNYKTNFIFELISVEDKISYNLEILDIASTKTEAEYYNTAIKDTIKNEQDYLLYSSSYTIQSTIYLDIKLINPYTKEIIFSKVYSGKTDYTINETLSSTVENVIQKINQQQLKENITQKSVKEENNDIDKKEKADKSIFFTINNKSKHEFFITYGLFKNHPDIFSYSSIYTGYNFYYTDFIFISMGITMGIGYQSEKLDFIPSSYNSKYIGTFTALYLRVSGIIEPYGGIRAELLYGFDQNLILSLPLVTGLKLHVTLTDTITFDASFPFTNFYIFDKIWGKNFNFGITVGYAKKI